VPTFLKVPVIPQSPQPPAASATDLISPQIDGIGNEDEWAGAGYYEEQGGVQATPQQIVSRLWYGFNKESAFLRLDARRAWADLGDETRVGFYLTRPGGGNEQPFSRISLATGSEETLLGFGANALLEVTVRGDTATATFYVVDEDGVYDEAASGLLVGVSGSTLEVDLPYADLREPEAGDVFRLRAVVSEGAEREIQVVPGSGPAQLVVPDLGLTTPLLTIVDPEGDDHGPGSYVYPTDAVFGPHAYDLTEFVVAEDDNNLVFRFTFAGPLNNDWGAPNGMGIHTLDVYIDAVQGGERKLLPGRNAALPEGSGWEFAIWAEGWTPGLYGPPTADAPQPVPLGDGSTLNILSDPGQRRITIRVPKKALAESLDLSIDALNPASWGYLGVVLGQEGYPASGVWRVRDIEPTAQQWRFGGAPTGINHTRIIDVAWPKDQAPTQEEMLGDYATVESGDLDDLSADDVVQLQTVRGQ
jgi:hypothetical protein